MIHKYHNDQASREFHEKPYQRLFFNQDVIALHSLYCLIGHMSCQPNQAKREQGKYVYEIHIESVAVLCVFPKMVAFVNKLVFIFLKSRLRLKLVDNCSFLICFRIYGWNNFGYLATIRKYTKTKRKLEIIMLILRNDIGGKSNKF